MASGPQRGFTRWMMVFFSLYALSESRLPYTYLPDHYRVLSGTRHDGIQPQVSTVQQQHRVRPRSVVVKCHPDSLEVTVQADVFHTGLAVEVAHLRLGSGSHGYGACKPEPSGPAEYTVRARLTDCGTQLSSTKEKIIYSNVLIYSPKPSSNGLLRLDGAAIPIECHYEMVYSVEAVPLLPTWVPSISRVTAEDKIDFSLRIMTADWQFGRGSSTYFLAELIHFEVSSVISNHKPLRVFVDRCVATATPDTKATLRYDFIEPNGCLADAYLTNSSSRFLPRTEEHKLRFQIDAFKFYKVPGDQVYITCYVSALPLDGNITSEKRACSLINSRWISVDGSNQDCRNCDISYQVKELAATEAPKTTIGIRPRPRVTSKESSVHNRLEQPASFVRVRTGMQHYPHSSLRASVGPRKPEILNEIERTITMRPLIVFPSTRTKHFTKEPSYL